MRIRCVAAAVLTGATALWWHRRRVDRALAGERLDRVLERAQHRRVRAELDEVLVLAAATDVINQAQAREE
ncbi:hypothetical protein [Streptomyces javensis]|uniref:Sensor histidine kinase n=1 Tax=Streptomyces javensis TaxID=114698 RepID=A0ABS0R3J5_9ACTN|nr:hypothetical protein [Streptomyces javensis]MBI0311650.1 hypothetical protein [Streptomyces javensis]